jgi:hypothetical protein
MVTKGTRRMMSFSNRIRAACFALGMSVAMLSGCTSRDPIASWQNRITRFVAKEGNGDPNVLRDAAQWRSRDAARPGRITFGRFNVGSSGDRPTVGTRDVQGVLLGQTLVESRPWYVFLLGVVDRSKGAKPGLDELRIAAMCVNGDDLLWRIAEPDQAALDKYLAIVEPKRVNPTTGKLARAKFPSPFDAFLLTQSNGVAVATEITSKAQWRVDLRHTALAGR